MGVVGGPPDPLPRGRDALVRTQTTERTNPSALLIKLKGVGIEFASLVWLEGLFRSFTNRRQVAAYAGLAPSPWQSGGAQPGPGHLQGRQSPLAARHDRNRLVLAASSAELGLEPLVPQSGRHSKRTGAAHRYRGLGPQAARRPVALRYARYRSVGRHPQGGVIR